MKNLGVLLLFILSLVALAAILRQPRGNGARFEPASLAPQPNRDAPVRVREWAREGRLDFDGKIAPLKQLDVGTLERSAKLGLASDQVGY